MTEEDEAFNEIERQAKQRKEAVRAAMRAIPWVGLTVEEIHAIGEIYAEKDGKIQMWGLFAVAVEEKLKEKNT
jgi:hypothetical protein